MQPEEGDVYNHLHTVEVVNKRVFDSEIRWFPAGEAAMLPLLQGSYDAFHPNSHCTKIPPLLTAGFFQYKKDGKRPSSRICEEKLLGLDF